MRYFKNGNQKLKYNSILIFVYVVLEIQASPEVNILLAFLHLFQPQKISVEESKHQDEQTFDT